MSGKLMLKRILLLAAVSISADGCVKGLGIEEFRQESDIGLFIKGGNVIRYNEDEFQLGFNGDRNEFWVTDDNMANYFILKCKKFPSEGDSVTADITYTTDNDIISRKGVVFQVLGYDSETEKISLWNQSRKIGVIVKVIR